MVNNQTCDFWGPNSSNEVQSEVFKDFGDAVYWDAEYANTCQAGAEDEVYDWFLGWDQLRQLLTPLVSVGASVLHLGSGNSPLPEAMYDAGFLSQTCIDISALCMAHMEERNRESRPQIRWVPADATALPEELTHGTFDLVLDKSTIDALLCHDEHALMLAKYVREAYRATGASGHFLVISMHRPKLLWRWLRHPAFDWRVNAMELIDSSDPPAAPAAGAEAKRPQRNGPHAFICSKRGRDGDSSLEARWPALLERVVARPDSDVSDDERPDCPECKQVMVWSRSATVGWSCRNKAICGKDECFPVRWRWFCECCGQHLCELCGANRCGGQEPETD